MLLLGRALATLKGIRFIKKLGKLPFLFLPQICLCKAVLHGLIIMLDRLLEHRILLTKSALLVLACCSV